ncbi:MAG: alpha/beta hydrolase [Mycobacterium sp.]
MGDRRWWSAAEAGFAIAAVTTGLLVGAASAAAEPAAGTSADTGVSDTPAQATKPSSTPTPAGDVDEAKDSSTSDTETADRADSDKADTEQADTEQADTDQADTDQADTDVPDTSAAEDPTAEVPEVVVDDQDSPAAPDIVSEARKTAHDATAGTEVKSAVAPSVETENAESDTDRQSDPPSTPSDEQIASARVASDPATANVQTVSVRTESAPAEPDSVQEEAVAATVAVAADADAVAAGAHQPSLLTVVGSLVMNLLMGLIHLVDGPPMLPAGSTVTVRTSSLTLPIGNGEQVEADWYFPDVIDSSTHLIYLQHGFMASGPMYSYTAAHLAERTNSIVVAPSLSSNFFDANADWVGGSTLQRAVAKLFEGSRTALTESASAAWGSAITLPDTYALVGHSAGGTLVTAVAGYLADDDAMDNLVGIVMLDGVEPNGSHAVNDALGKLTGKHYRPIYLISSQRYMWNRGGDMADKLLAARPNTFNGVGLVGGTHIDYMEGGNGLLQFSEYLISGFSLRENIDAAGIITAGWVNDLFGGTTDNGVYGTTGQSISIATPTKPATAVVLPLGPAGPSPLGEYFDTLLTNVFEYAGANLLVYEPLT